MAIVFLQSNDSAKIFFVIYLLLLQYVGVFFAALKGRLSFYKYVYDGVDVLVLFSFFVKKRVFTLGA